MRLDLLPTGAGETGTLDAGALQSVHAASWFPRGDRLLLAATEPGQGSRLYVQPLDGRAESMTPEGFTFYGDALAPDGKRIAAVGPRDQPVLWNIPDGVGRDIPGLASGDIPIGWSADGTTLYVARRGELPARVDAVDLQPGQKRLWKTFMPPDPAGVGAISSILVSADACSSG